MEQFMKIFWTRCAIIRDQVADNDGDSEGDSG